MLDRFSLAGNAVGALRTANVLNRVLGQPGASVRVASADDAMADAHLQLDHGLVRPGTRVSVDRFATVVRAGALAIEAAVLAEAHVDDEAAGHLTVGVSDLRVSEGPSEIAQVTSLAASLASRDLDLAQVGKGVGLQDARVQMHDASATIRGARRRAFTSKPALRTLAFHDGRPVGRVALAIPDLELPLLLLPNALLLLPKGVSIEAGRARASISAEVDLERAAGTGVAHVFAQGLRARVGDEPLEGDLHVDLKARESDGGSNFTGSTLAFDGTVGSPPTAW